jgi:REP element-mobilizing transposase RayT
MTYDYKQFYRRKLPHRHSPGSTLFVTFRLVGSVPRQVIDKWKADRKLLALERERTADRALVHHLEKDFARRWFGRFEAELHLEKGPVWLKDPAIAQIVADSLHFLDGSAYDLHAFSVMPNHGHVLFTPFLNNCSLTEVRSDHGLVRFESNHRTLDSIMKSLKGFTAREANKILGRRGQFWDTESYDHEVRDGLEFKRIKRYILNNPVKAGLVQDWRDWTWNWVEGEKQGCNRRPLRPTTTGWKACRPA